MSKTYIAHLPERYIEKRSDGEEWLQMPVNVSGHELTIKTVIPLTPYAEPDLAQVMKETYQRGLNDAWDAARKITGSVMDGCFNYNELNVLFGSKYPESIINKYSAYECIEKIRQYEQEQQIQVGDEVVFYNGEKCVVTVVEDGQVAEVMDKGGFSMRMDDGLRNSMKKTGRHFPEIVKVLKKMQEGE